MSTKKKWVTHLEILKYGPHKEKQVVGRNHPRASKSFGLTRQRFKSAILNTFKEITEIMFNEVRYKNSVSSNRE